MNKPLGKRRKENLFLPFLIYSEVPALKKTPKTVSKIKLFMSISSAGQVKRPRWQNENF